VTTTFEMGSFSINLVDRPDYFDTQIGSDGNFSDR